MGIELAIIATIVSVAGTGLAMYGQGQQSKAEQEAANFEANTANNNAKIADDNARIQSLANEQSLTDKRRRNAIIQANTEAKYAKTGVAMSSASVMDTMIEEAGVLEQEAQQESYEGRGKVRALKQRATDYRSQGRLLKYKGKSARSAGKLGMLATGIGGIGSAISAGSAGYSLGSKYGSSGSGISGVSKSQYANSTRSTPYIPK